MSDDKLKRSARGIKADRCGVCGHTAYLCPTCPERLSGRRSSNKLGWDTVWRKSPELAAILVRNAKAAKILAGLEESDPSFAEWDREYQAAGKELLDYRSAHP